MSYKTIDWFFTPGGAVIYFGVILALIVVSLLYMTRID